MVNCANVWEEWFSFQGLTNTQRQFSISLSVHFIPRNCRSDCNYLKRLRWSVQVILTCSFCVCATLETIENGGRTWFASHPMKLVLSGWPDWCWHFYCRSLTIHCYLCCLWFSDRMHRLYTPRGCHAKGYGTGWCTEGQYTLAQIFSDLAESQRPLLFSPVTCSLTGVHQMLQAACTVPCMSSSGRCNIHFGAKGWNCFHGVRIKCNLVVHHRKWVPFWAIK